MFSCGAIHKAWLNHTSTVWFPCLLISLMFPTEWSSFTSYTPSRWCGCRAAVCGRIDCVPWFEVEMSSRSVAAWSLLIFLKLCNNVTKNVELFNGPDNTFSTDVFFFLSSESFVICFWYNGLSLDSQLLWTNRNLCTVILDFLSV